MKQILLFLIIGVFAGTACAQYDPGATAMIAQNNMMYNSTIQSFVNQNIINDLAYGNTKSGAKRTGTKTSGAVNISSFSFAPTAKVSAAVIRDIISNEKKRHPNSILDQALSQPNNPFPAYVRLLNTLGLDVQHNYANAFTAYMLGMWRIANGMSANPTVAQIRKVRDQIEGILNVGKWSNARKQEATEYMIYDLIFANEPYEGSRKDGDKNQLRQDSDRVYYRFLKQNKMDFRKMEITDAGLVSRE